MIYNYKIYQISLERQGAEQLALRPYTPCEDKPDAVSSGAYDLVYSGTLTCEPNWSTSRILERLFRVLNMENPQIIRRAASPYPMWCRSQVMMGSGFTTATFSVSGKSRSPRRAKCRSATLIENIIIS